MTKEEAVNILRANVMVACDTSDKVGYGTPLNKAIEEALDMAIKALEQQTNDCMIFGTKENCFGGATENECEHCDYKIQKLEQHSEDCVSRTEVLKIVEYHNNPTFIEPMGTVRNILKDLPPVTPTHGTCKDCTNYVVGVLDEEICIRGHELIHKDFYCADYEKAR